MFQLAKSENDAVVLGQVLEGLVDSFHFLPGADFVVRRTAITVLVVGLRANLPRDRPPVSVHELPARVGDAGGEERAQPGEKFILGLPAKVWKIVTGFEQSLVHHVGGADLVPKAGIERADAR